MADAPDQYFYHMKCPACRSEFSLPPNLLGKQGQQVRCSICRHIWHYKARVGDLTSHTEMKKKQTLRQQAEERSNQSKHVEDATDDDSAIPTEISRPQEHEKPSAKAKDEGSLSQETLNPARRRIEEELKEVVALVKSMKEEQTQEANLDKQKKDHTDSHSLPNQEASKTREAGALKDAATDAKEPRFDETDTSLAQDSLLSVLAKEENKKKDEESDHARDPVDPPTRASPTSLQDQARTQADSQIGDPIQEKVTIHQKTSKSASARPLGQDQEISHSQGSEDTGDLTKKQGGDELVDQEKLAKEWEASLGMTDDDEVEEAHAAKKEDKAQSEDETVDQEKLAKEWEASLGMTDDDEVEEAHAAKKEDKTQSEDETVDQEKLAKEWEASLGMTDDDEVEEAHAAKKEDKTQSEDETVDQEKLAKEWEASLNMIDDDALEGARADKKKTVDQEHATLEDDSFVREFENEDMASKELAKALNDQLEDSVAINTEEETSLSPQDADSLVEGWKSEITTGKPGDQPTPKTHDDAMRVSNVHASFSLEATSQEPKGKPTKSAFSRFLQRRREKRLRKKEEKALKRGEKKLAQTLTDFSDVDPGITQAVELFEDNQPSIAPKDREISSKGSIFSKLQHKRKLEAEESSIQEKKILDEQKERLERNKQISELRKNIEESRQREHRAQSVYSFFGLLLFFALVGASTVIATRSLPNIVEGLPEIAPTLRKLGIQTYAPGENITIENPEIILIPHDDGDNLIRLRGRIQNTMPDQARKIPNLFVIARQNEGTTQKLWEIDLPDKLLEPGEAIAYETEELISSKVEELLIGFRISNIPLKEEYLFLRQ